MKIATFCLAAIACLLSGTSFAADAVAGKTVFGKCALCHTADPAKKGIGPTLFGVLGRPSGSVEGYTYSPAMKAAGKTWDEATLDGYLADPKTFVPGNKMTFAGLPKEEDRTNVIAYLATLK
jgi:cytochrome c